MSVNTRLLQIVAITAAVLLASPGWAQSLTMRQALSRALAANPKLTAAERDVGIAAGRSIQANAIPNPELSVQAENVLGSRNSRGFQSAEITSQLSQLIELGGKREARNAAGLAELDNAGWQREAARLEVLSEAASAFIQVLFEQNRIRILDRQVETLNGLQPLLQRRVEAGASSQPEILRAQLAADLVRVESQKARTALATARRELAILMGQSSPTFTAVQGNLSVVREPPPFKTVIDAIGRNPQLMRWTAVRAQRDAELLIARLKAVPDVRLGVGWRHSRETGDNSAVLGLSIPLPVWDQNRGDILAARESLEKVQAERDIVKAVLVSLAGRSYDNAIGALREISLLRDTVLPNARRAVQAIEDGYGQGRFSLLEMLDVQAATTEAELREEEALRSFHVAVATIEGLVGRPFLLAGRTRR